MYHPKTANVTDLGVENTRPSLPRQQLDFFDPYKYGVTVAQSGEY